MPMKWLTHFCDDRRHRDKSSIKIWRWQKQYNVHTWVLTTMSRILESIYNVVQCASSPWTFFRWKPHFFVICALNPTLCTYYCCPSSSAILYTLLLTDIELYIFSSANPFIIRLCGLKSALIAMRSTVGHFESSMSSKGKIDYF